MMPQKLKDSVFFESISSVHDQNNLNDQYFEKFDEI